MAKERRIDARELEPPEPLELALRSAHDLQAGEYLRMLHRREPYPLYRLLREEGFHYSSRPGPECPFEILIWRPDDEEAVAAVQRLIEPDA